LPSTQSIPFADSPPARFTQGARSRRVIQSAIRLFAQKGFQGTKTKEIAEASGVNEALIFRDFQTKEKLYCAILEYASSRINAERWIEDLARHIEKRRDESVFSGLALKFFKTYSQERELFRLMLYSALEQHELARKFRERQVEPVQRFLEEYIRTRQYEGAIRQADPAVLTKSYLCMCHHYVLRHVLFGEPASPVTAKTCMKIFLDGVRCH
jgi:AcrR family transcriptional regulator